MRVTARSVLRACAAFGLCLTATSAWAQAPRPPAFRPDLSTTLLYDDNVFRRPTGETVDLILRVSPGFELKHDSTRLTLGSHYRFDAERFQDHSTLSTMLARQAGGLDLTVRPFSRLAFTSSSGLPADAHRPRLEPDDGHHRRPPAWRRGETSPATSRTYRLQPED